MQKDFLSEFFGNQARARILRLLTAVADAEYTLDEIRKKAQVKSVALVQRELNALARFGLIKTGLIEAGIGAGPGKKAARTKVWALDREHPYAQALRLFVRDTQQPIDEGVVSELRRSGKLRLVIASGRFLDAEGGAHDGVDLIIVGENMNESKVQGTLRTIEADRGREILYAVFSPKEFKFRLDVQDRLIRNVLDYPHHILFDKLNVL